MKIPFDIAKRPQIESGEYKVETFSGYPVTIYRWDFDDGARTPIMGSYVFEDSKEYVGAWDEEGHFDLMSPNDLDLFLITPEPELTEFEKALQDIVNARDPKNPMTDEGARNNATILFELARKEIVDEWSRGLHDTQDRSGKAYNDGYQLGFERGGEALKDLPRWSKNAFTRDCAAIDISGLTVADYIRREGKLLSISDLEKLPGFTEE